MCHQSFPGLARISELAQAGGDKRAVPRCLVSPCISVQYPVSDLHHLVLCVTCQRHKLARWDYQMMVQVAPEHHQYQSLSISVAAGRLA